MNAQNNSMRVTKKIQLAALVLVQIMFISCKNTVPEEIAESSKVRIDTTSNSKITNESDQKNETVAIDSSSQTTGQQDGCFAKSKFSLPYNQKNAGKVSYQTLSCSVAGTKQFLCENEKLRYISLPDYKNIKVILIPQDCGDFNYRFYLLTILNDKVISNQYVEGEWYEPGDDTYKELTSFSIDSNYIITVKTNIVENGITSNKEKLVFKITDTGTLSKK